jgi:large subunit ribosomal protein L1
MDNANALLESVIRAKPAAAKGSYLLNVAVSTTMGLGVRVDPTTLHRQTA